MATKLERLCAFLRRHRLAKRITVLHLSVDGDERVITTMDESAIKKAYKEGDQLPDDIMSDCQNDCDSQGGASKYSVQVSDGDRLVAAHVIKLESSEMIEDPLAIDPNISNLSQGQALVRTIEVLQRIITSSLVTVQRGYQSLIVDQRAEIKELRRREQIMADAAQRLLSVSPVNATQDLRNPPLDKLVSLLETAVPQALHVWGGGRYSE